MPHIVPVWFSDLFGFTEGSSYSANRAHFSIEEDETSGERYLLCDCAPPHGRRQFVGEFETPSLGELRNRLSASSDQQQQGLEEVASTAGASGKSDGSSGGSGGISYQHLCTPVGVQALIMDPVNAGSVFQAASQFNCLEMVGPGVSPARGIAIYHEDPTQGPKCALACPAGTVYRNYLSQRGEGQAGKRGQIDCLTDVGRVLGNTSGSGGDGGKEKKKKETGRFWTMQNGYCLPVTTKSMGELGRRLQADPGLAAEAAAAHRVGVHWSTSVAPSSSDSSPRHRVAQVYASAVPVAYSQSTKSKDWEPFARLVLEAAYDATLAAARVKLEMDNARASAAGAGAASEEGEASAGGTGGYGGGGRIKVFLTALGGNAFGNRIEWIRDAIIKALDKHRDAPLDVFQVHYGGTVKGQFKSIKVPPRKKNEKKLVPFHHGGEQAPAAAQEAEQKQKQRYEAHAPVR